MPMLRFMAYGRSVAFGTVYALLMALAALFLFFVVTFPWENQADPGDDDWLIVVAFTMFGAAAVVFLGVMARFPWLVVPGLVVGAAAGALALRYALVDWSDHGDEELLAFAAVVAVSGLLASMLTARAARERAVQPWA